MNLSIKNVTKSFKKIKALDNISLNIKPGIFGLVGTNGAGKTTLMKCILGLYKYQGDIEMAKDNYSVGYLPQSFEVLKELSVNEAMRYFAIIKGLKDYSEINILLDMVGMLDQKNKKIKALSGGMRRRVGIAQAMLNNPDVLIIDEPTAGLDPEERVRFRNILAKIKKNKITIVSTHIMEDLTIIGDNIAIIDKGRLVINDTKDNILKGVKSKVGIITVKEEEIQKFKEKYIVSREDIGERGYMLRVISDNFSDKVELVEPILEDAYFYYMKVRRNEN